MSAVLREVKAWHVWLGLGVFFGAVFAVNGAFIYFALATHPGDDVKDAYVGGLKFNQEIAENRAQQKLGWQASLNVDPDLRGGQIIEIAFVDTRAKPVRGLKLEAKLRHPVLASLDRPIEFHTVRDGVFRANIDEPPSAQWDLIVEARSDLGQVFRLRHRL